MIQDMNRALRLCRGLSRTLHQLLADLDEHLSEEDLYPIFGYFLAKSTQTFDAAVLLLTRGYVNDAAILIRTIHECFVAIWWLSHGEVPSNVERFTLYGILEIGEMSTKPLPHSPALIERAIALHHSPSGKLKQSWTGKDLRSLVQEVSKTLEQNTILDQEYLHNYRIASKLVHSTPAAALLYEQRGFHADPRTMRRPFMQAWTLAGWAVTYIARIGVLVALELAKRHESFNTHADRIHALYDTNTKPPPTS